MNYVFIFVSSFVIILQPTHDPVCCICASDKLLILVSVVFLRKEKRARRQRAKSFVSYNYHKSVPP